MAQSAFAAKGVYDTFGATGIKGGEFGSNNSQGISGVAVNSSGLGLADPGDVYVLDRDQNRVQRFDAQGGFISTWGLDVEIGGGTGFEICTIAANCKAGSSGGVGGAFNFASSLALSGIAVNQSTGVPLAKTWSAPVPNRPTSSSASPSTPAPANTN
jgi:hypothetical protein